MIAQPRPQSEADPAALDIIFIEGFRGNTIIGIHAGEFDRPQPLVIDIQAGLPRARACDTDQIGDTIDYSTVRLRLQRLLAEHRLRLLEAFAEAVAAILIDEFAATWVRVAVRKPNKFADVEAMGVQIERRAAPRGLPGRGAAVLHLLGSGLVPGAR